MSWSWLIGIDLSSSGWLIHFCQSPRQISSTCCSSVLNTADRFNEVSMDIFLLAVPERKYFTSKTNTLWKLLPSLKARLPRFRSLAESSNSVKEYVGLVFLIIFMIIFPKNKKLYYVVAGQNIQTKRSFSAWALTFHFSCWFKKSDLGSDHVQITLGCSGLCPAGIWLTSRTEILHQLWITSSNDCLHCEEVFSTV